MLSNYTPTKPVPSDCSERYAAGWRYADWFLSKGGTYEAESPDGWYAEKYEGWWDRLAREKRDQTASRQVWVSTKVSLPAPGRIVLCRLQHCNTLHVQEHRLLRVAESDVDWRIAADRSELSYDWSVIAWLAA